MLTLIFARRQLVHTCFFAFIGTVVELQGFLRRPASGVRNVCDDTAGEFHEFGGLANDEY
jgi:hypothetical protein